MSKPLTIDELKALEVGDWVWVEAFDKHYYYKILVPSVDEMVFSYRHYTDVMKYSDYGTKWFAYKNKEMAEAKGEIVELPCLRDKPTLFYHGEPILRKELNYMTDDGTICSVSYSEDEFAEAEHRLAELKGEKR